MDNKQIVKQNRMVIRRNRHLGYKGVKLMKNFKEIDNEILKIKSEELIIDQNNIIRIGNWLRECESIINSDTENRLNSELITLYKEKVTTVQELINCNIYVFRDLDFITDDITKIQELFNDIQRIVEDQDSDIEIIEKNIDVTNEDVSQSNIDLESAENSIYTNYKIKIVSGVMIVVAIMGYFIV